MYYYVTWWGRWWWYMNIVVNNFLKKCWIFHEVECVCANWNVLMMSCACEMKMFKKFKCRHLLWAAFLLANTMKNCCDNLVREKYLHWKLWILKIGKRQRQALKSLEITFYVRTEDANSAEVVNLRHKRSE